jgi:hypothetical protein
VQPVSSESLPGIAVDVKLDAVAVEFDLVEPIGARRRFAPERSELGLDEAWHRRMFFSTPRHNATHSSKSPSPEEAGRYRRTIGSNKETASAATRGYAEAGSMRSFRQQRQIGRACMPPAMAAPLFQI